MEHYAAMKKDKDKDDLCEWMEWFQGHIKWGGKYKRA